MRPAPPFLRRPPISTKQKSPRLLALLVREAGKTLDNAIADLREAVDFLRYYADAGAGGIFESAMRLPGPTGESNELTLHGRGVFACIAPWNFPLAIFTGQVAAALAAGNAVVAKPAEQTPLVAFEAVKLLHQAGVPPASSAFPAGRWRARSARLFWPIRLCRALPSPVPTKRRRSSTGRSRRATGPFVSLIAETGGMNAMIVDSSALPEQAVRDVLASAFDSAGQRCSAARLLFVQDDVAHARHPHAEGRHGGASASAIRSIMPPISAR